MKSTDQIRTSNNLNYRNAFHHANTALLELEAVGESRVKDGEAQALAGCITALKTVSEALKVLESDPDESHRLIASLFPNDMHTPEETVSSPSDAPIKQGVSGTRPDEDTTLGDPENQAAPESEESPADEADDNS